jgi:hypothetical protein
VVAATTAPLFPLFVDAIMFLVNNTAEDALAGAASSFVVIRSAGVLTLEVTLRVDLILVLPLDETPRHHNWCA